MSLYRKYRPKIFADVSGQDHAVTTLEHAVTQEKLAHAYLFAGSRGTGKTSVARILAKAMLTRGVEDATLKRQITEAVDDGSLVDLVEIDAASNRGIDDIRTLVEKIQFSPVVSTAKVYIIDEVHMLTREAFNALLKTLEEPPPYAYFILATTELQKIPPTIQSRCQRFTFKQIGEEDIIRRLQYVADQEKITIERDALRAIARHAQGGLRDALSLLDQLQSLDSVTLADVRQRVGESGAEEVGEVFRALAAADEPALLAVVGRLEQAGIPLDVFVRQLLAEARTRLHAAVDAKEDVRPHGDLLHALLGCLRDLRLSPVPGLVLESALLAVSHGGGPAETPRPRAAVPKAAPSPRREEAPPAPPSTRPTLTEAPKSASAAPRAATPIPPSQSAILVEAPEISMETLRRAWPEIVNAVAPASTKMSLKNGRLLDVRGSTLILAFPSAFHRDKVAQTDSSRKVEEVLEQRFKRAIKLECILEEERRSVASPRADAVDLAEAAADVF